MCGRYSLTTPPEAMARVFRTTGPLPNLPPRYNIAPTQDSAVVRLAADGARELALLRWGLVPSWSQGPDAKYSMINARAETVAEKPAYRAAFRSRRCLVPADGFFEWRADGKRKQPFFIRIESREPFAFAGLWERWEKESAPVIQSFTIVVTEANALMRPIHERMPVIIHAEDHGAWLDPKTPAAQAQAMLRPFEAEAMEAYPVGTRVNSPRNDDADCIAPAGA
jgi:putative SOS response-associated peptidase YedK